MSDLFEARAKTEQGAEWRGTIDVEIDDEHHELTIRQLVDPEFWEVMSLIDMDELENLESDLPEEEVKRFAELQDKKTLTDDEQEELSDLQSRVEESDVNIFEALSKDTYNGLKLAAKYCVEPDQEDIQTALAQHADDIEEMYGGMSSEEARKYLNDNVISPMIESSTDFTSFAIGIRAISETLDDEGN